MPDQSLHVWQPERRRPPPPVPPGGPVASLPVALWRGLRGRCPGCGRSPIFAGFLRVAGPCKLCGTPIEQVRADDAPPYFTIIIVAHIVIPGVLFVELAYAPPFWLQGLVWLPLTLLLAVGLLRPVKGATVALMLKLNMLKAEDEA